MDTRDNHKDLLDALDAIDPSTLTYQEWTSCGMALHESGFTWQDWDRWSQWDSERYHEGECERKWKSFGRGLEKATAGTIIAMAEARGWTPRRADDTPFGWDDYITGEDMPDWADEEDVDINGGDWQPARELSDYLSAIFDDADHVCYVTETYEKDGHYMPKRGHWDRTAEELREGLSKHADIGAVLGDWNPAAGAWICFNPTDGQGRGNQNITEFRYALVESDTLEVEKQMGMIRAMKLPCAAVVSSGNKSIHAIVHIDAGTDYALYRKRVERLYAYCTEHGFSPDTANKNPSRLSRMPGITRGDSRQKLLELNIGYKDWSEWEEWADESEDDLPENVSAEDWLKDLPPLKEVLIGTQEAGILRVGHKGMLAGPSKAGKSFAMIELALAVASGGQWLGYPCRQGRVLYVNLEIDSASFAHRLIDVTKSLGIDGSTWAKSLDVLNLRGRVVTMDKLAPQIMRRCLKINNGESGAYSLIVIDPIYKTLTGDENDAHEMAQFMALLDKLTFTTGAAVFSCHHHSKGLQGRKRAIDRAAGSGVISRDLDALLDMSPLEVPEDSQKELKGATAWRIDATLREFASPDPIDVLFIYPKHLVEATGKTKKWKVEGEDPLAKERDANRAKNKRQRKENAELMQKAFDDAVAAGCANDDGYIVDVADLLDHMGTREEDGEKPSENTIKRWAKMEWCPIGSKRVDMEGYRGKMKQRIVFFDRQKELEKEFFEDEEDDL